MEMERILTCDDGGACLASVACDSVAQLSKARGRGAVSQSCDGAECLLSRNVCGVADTSYNYGNSITISRDSAGLAALP